MNIKEDKQKSVSQSRILWKYLRDQDDPVRVSRIRRLWPAGNTKQTSSNTCNGTSSKINEKCGLITKINEWLINPLDKPIFNEKKTELVKVDFDKFPSNFIANNKLDHKGSRRNSMGVKHLPNPKADIEQLKCSILNTAEKRKRNLELPLSPESRKKDELCSYLQLVNLNSVNPQEHVLYQNRRSTRVKNLLLLTEKKNLESKLKRPNKSDVKDTIVCEPENQLKNNNNVDLKNLRSNGTNKSIALKRKQKRIDFVKEYFRSNKYNKIIKSKRKLNKTSMQLQNEILAVKRKKIKNNNKNVKKEKSYTKDQINEIILGGNSRTETKKEFKKRKLQFGLKRQTLRSRLHYNNIPMKKFIELIEVAKPRKLKNIRKKQKVKEKGDSSVLPLLEHDYAKTNEAVEPNTFTDHTYTLQDFVTRDIICGASQKENKSECSNTTDNKKLDDTFFKTSILKERLIFNTLLPQSELQQSKSVNKDNLRNAASQATSDEELHDKAIKQTVQVRFPAHKHDEEHKKVTKIDVQETEELVITKDVCNKVSDNCVQKIVQTKVNNNVEKICNNGHTFTSLDNHVESNSLYKSLTQLQNQKSNNKRHDNDLSQTWYSEETSKAKDKRNSHSIHISKDNGNVLDAIYIDNSLVIIQELLVTFYNQSPLGNVLGAQNMWLPRGHIQRLLLDNTGCLQKETSSKVINFDNSVSYVELWTKEHKSDKRERPVCDVFAAIYFLRAKQTKPDKKVLQLENIKAFANDVRYIVKSTSRHVIVSWSEIKEDKRKSIIRCYNFESDYQTVASVTEMQSVDYLITSLHNIEDGDLLLMGFSESKATLWNLEYGYMIASIDIWDIKPQPQPLWVKCEGGFLFTLQDTQDGNLRLVAIRGTNHSWKQLTSFKPPEEYSSLRGACIEHGTLVAFYENGVLCWNAQTGELLMEAESSNLMYFPSSKHVVIKTEGQVLVKHALSYLITV